MLLLHELLKDWPCTFTGDTFKVPITGITEHSRRVKQGDLFVARKGACNDGVMYINEAIQLGAVAVVVDRILPLTLTVPVIVVANSQHFLSYASARLAGNPSERLTVIAITGTNGKTTVAHFIGQLLQGLGIKSAVLGTLGAVIDGVKSVEELPMMTTLPAEYLHPLLAHCEAVGVTHVVMEASSLGLSTERLAHCEIDIGLLLNIGEDHYDEHGSERAYLRAKAQLVQMANEVIVNGDDRTCMKLARLASGKNIYFGETDRADYRLTISDEQTIVQTPTLTKELHPLHVEHFNQLNLLAAITAVERLSYRYEKIEPIVRRLTLPAGRMERIEHNNITVIIDYAHTPEALETVLQSIVAECLGRVFVVFGCGGNRDCGKRKRMGEVVARYAETVIVTSDNPRYEDPVQIIEDVVAGIPKQTLYEVEVDREVAIQRAIELAKAQDIVVIAGKGHEKTQQIGGMIYPFSDQEIAKNQLLKKIDE